MILFPHPCFLRKEFQEQREALRESQSVIDLGSQPVDGRAGLWAFKSPCSVPLCCPVQTRKMFHRSPVASSGSAKQS